MPAEPQLRRTASAAAAGQLQQKLVAVKKASHVVLVEAMQLRYSTYETL